MNIKLKTLNPTLMGIAQPVVTMVENYHSCPTYKSYRFTKKTSMIKKICCYFLMVGSFVFYPRPANAQNIPVIMGADGSFLGTLEKDRFANNSICNSYGDYGSRYSSKSVLNRYGDYGGAFSEYGSYNPRSSKPPVVVYQGKIRAFITKNTRFRPLIDPDNLVYMFCNR